MRNLQFQEFFYIFLSTGAQGLPDLVTLLEAGPRHFLFWVCVLGEGKRPFSSTITPPISMGCCHGHVLDFSSKGPFRFFFFNLGIWSLPTFFSLQMHKRWPAVIGRMGSWPKGVQIGGGSMVMYSVYPQVGRIKMYFFVILSFSLFLSPHTVWDRSSSHRLQCTHWIFRLFPFHRFFPLVQKARSVSGILPRTAFHMGHVHL